MSLEGLPTSDKSGARSRSMWVEFDEVSPRVCGVVHPPSGPHVRFDGWLELMGVVNDLVGAP